MPVSLVLRSSSGLGVGDGIKNHTGKWLQASLRSMAVPLAFSNRTSVAVSGALQHEQHTKADAGCRSDLQQHQQQPTDTLRWLPSRHNGERCSQIPSTPNHLQKYWCCCMFVRRKG